MFVLVHTVRVCFFFGCIAKSLSKHKKTGTSTGFKSDMMFDTSRGILVNVSTSLFERLRRDRRKVEVNVVAVEICGQRILDMLRPSKSAWGTCIVRGCCYLNSNK